MGVGNAAFHVHHAIDHLGGVIVMRRQGQQVRLFLGVSIDRTLFDGSMDAYVGLVGQPPTGHFIKVFQATEGASIEQAGPCTTAAHCFRFSSSRRRPK